MELVQLDGRTYVVDADDNVLRTYKDSSARTGWNPAWLSDGK